MNDTEQVAYDNSAKLSVAVGPLTAPTVCRVISMIAARAGCPIDRLDDAMLICDAITAHASEHVLDGRLSMSVWTDADVLVLRVDPLAPGGARGIIAQEEVPGVGNVLERVASELRVLPSDDGRSEALEIELRF